MRAPDTLALTGAMVLCLLLPWSGCDGSKTNTAGRTTAREGKDENPDRDLVVATVGDTAITVGMLSDELNKQNPYIRMRFTSVERKEEFLKNMVRFEVLAAEAQKRGLQRDPEVVRRVKRVMIDRLMEELHGTLVKMEDITDKDVQAYYNAHRSEYHQLARVRASQIVTASQADAEKVIAEAKTKPGDPGFFGELAIKHTVDVATKERRGDLDFFARDSKTIPREIVDAAFAIKGLWQIGGPIKTDKGYVVLMKTGQVDEVNRPLEQERQRIRNRLFNERRIKAVEKLVGDLQAKSKVEINKANLAKVSLDPSAVPAEPRGSLPPR